MKLNEIVKYLNENYNQGSDNYNLFFGAKPEIIRLDETTAISTFDGGAIVVIGDETFFIKEDDGNWWIKENAEHTLTVYQTGYLKSVWEAMKRLDEYLEQNGIVHHYIFNSSFELEEPEFSDFPCGYALGVDEDKQYIEEWKKQKNEYKNKHL